MTDGAARRLGGSSWLPNRRTDTRSDDQSAEAPPDAPSLAQVVTYCRVMIKAARLRPASAAVLMVIASHYNKRDGHARPSQATLADEMNMTERGVRDIVHELAAAGIFVADRIHSRAAIRYRFPVQAFARGIPRGEPPFRSELSPEGNGGSPQTGTAVPDRTVQQNVDEQVPTVSPPACAQEAG